MLNTIQFEIEFFRGVANKLGWKDTMIDWKCMGWDEMMTDIVANQGTFGNGTCDMAVAGFAAVPVSSFKRMLNVIFTGCLYTVIRKSVDLLQKPDRKGLEFTWPSTRVGKRLMVLVRIKVGENLKYKYC